MKYYPSPKEAIKLAELRQKSKKKYESLMQHLFSVYTDFVIFDREFGKVYEKFEEMRRKAGETE